MKYADGTEMQVGDKALCNSAPSAYSSIYTVLEVTDVGARLSYDLNPTVTAKATRSELWTKFESGINFDGTKSLFDPTATGRLSSTNSNLQNIPIRTDLGREIRAAFTPTTSLFDGHAVAFGLTALCRPLALDARDRLEREQAEYLGFCNEVERIRVDMAPKAKVVTDRLKLRDNDIAFILWIELNGIRRNVSARAKNPHIFEMVQQLFAITIQAVGTAAAR